jgi:NitT/TauT family transport system substrate-binding protein
VKTNLGTTVTSPSRSIFGRLTPRAGLLAMVTGLLAMLTMAGSASAADKWRHGILTAKGDAGFFYMAQHKGFYKKHGLDVEIIEFRGSKDLLRALLAGELDTADATPSDVTIAFEKGAKIKYIGSTMIGYPYVLYARKGLTKPEALAGKTLGISGVGSAPHIFGLVMLRKLGVNVDDLKLANAGGTGSRMKALIGGRIDVTAGASEFVPQAAKLGFNVLGTAAKLAPLFPRYYITARDETLKAKGAQAINFLAGQMEGLDYALKHRDETIALTAKINNGRADDPEYAYMFDEIKNNKYISVKSEIAREPLVWMQDMMVELGEQDKKVNIENFIDESYRKQALVKTQAVLAGK